MDKTLCLECRRSASHRAHGHRARNDRGVADEPRSYRTPTTTLDCLAPAPTGAGALRFLPANACLSDLSDRSFSLSALAPMSSSSPLDFPEKARRSLVERP